MKIAGEQLYLVASVERMKLVRDIGEWASALVDIDMAFAVQIGRKTHAWIFFESHEIENVQYD